MVAMTRAGWLIHLFAFLLVLTFGLNPFGRALDGAHPIWDQKTTLLDAVETVARREPWPIIGAAFEPDGGDGRYVIETLGAFDLMRHEVDATTGRMVASGSEPFRKLLIFMSRTDIEELRVSLPAAIRAAEDHSGGKTLTARAALLTDGIGYRVAVSKADRTVMLFNIDGSHTPPAVFPGP